MNGKIEILIGGIKRSLWFNNYAKAALGAIYGLDPLEAGEKMMAVMSENYMKAIADLVFAGLEGFYNAEDIQKDYTKKDVLRWCADSDEADMILVFNTWLDFSKLREIIKTEPSGKPEKKRRGKMS